MQHQVHDRAVDEATAPDVIAQVVLDRLASLDRAQLEPQPKPLGEESRDVAVDAGEPTVARRGERREVLIDGDLEPPFRPDLIEVLANHGNGVRVDPRARPAGQGEGREPGERRATAMPHCSATVSSQERIAQIASWFSTPSNGGM